MILLVTDPDPPTNIVLRQVNNGRVQATWNSPVNFAESTYLVYINTDTSGTKVASTNYTTESNTAGYIVTLSIRATTGTYLSVPAVSETLTVQGMITF